jgi:NAD(P)-dependent dehydrogenase (short-subunit alcohol dehydrogenase family)
MDRLKGKAAIVTGATHGIGRAIAQLFAEEGASVVITDIDAEAGEAAASEFRAAGGEAVFCHADASSAADAARSVQLAISTSKRLDILCNNAAWISEFHDVLSATDEEWALSIGVGLLGAQYMTREALPIMIQQHSGSVINIVSIQGMVGCPTSVAYTTVKAGLLGFTRSAAYDYGPQNIRVNAICPGPIQTRISPKPGTPLYDWQCGNTVLKRVGYPREVACAALFLASDESSYVTGITLPVDGGWTSI